VGEAWEVLNVAIARDSADLWAHVQRKAWPVDASGNNVRMLPLAPTVHVCADDEVWHLDVCHGRADALLAELEAAVSAGRDRRAARLRAAWIRQVHADRIAWARQTATERGLRMDPVGRGPVIDRPTVHYRDRLPWYLTPVFRYLDRRLPDSASAVLDGWNGTGKVFDSLCLADEPVSSGQFPAHSLIGTISADGRCGEWFVLDRWAS
jgi:hypothetical protein